MPIKFEVTAITGEYNGKPKYKRVGSVIEKDGKFYLKMDHLVTTKDDGTVANFFSLYTPRPKEESAHNQAKANAYQKQPEGFGDLEDLPFAPLHKRMVI